MSVAVLKKRPEEKFAVGLIYEAPDLEESQTLTGAEVTITPDEEGGLKKFGNVVVEDDRVSQMIKGGIDGHDYYIKFLVTSSVQHKYEDAIFINVRDIVEEEW